MDTFGFEGDIAMAWTYHQWTGLLEHNGHRIARGYSGAPGYSDNPMTEQDADRGTIPRGRYRIEQMQHAYHKHDGKILVDAMPLTPIGHDAYGRTGLLIHGDNNRQNHTASSGCIILEKQIRQRISHGGDKYLEVVL